MLVPWRPSSKQISDASSCFQSIPQLPHFPRHPKARLVPCLYSNLVGGMQRRDDWLPDPLPELDPSHAKYSAQPGCWETKMESVSWQPGLREPERAACKTEKFDPPYKYIHPNKCSAHPVQIDSVNQSVAWCMHSARLSSAWMVHASQVP